MKVRKRKTESTTSVMMTQTIFSHESSYLANCRSVHVSVHCGLFFVQSVQEGSAHAMTAAHRDPLVLASNAQWPGIQPLVSRGQIVSTDLP